MQSLAHVDSCSPHCLDLLVTLLVIRVYILTEYCARTEIVRVAAGLDSVRHIHA